MKLHSRFKEVVGRLRREGALTRAWFTTFNLSPYLVESYLLPALVGDPPCPVKSMGFEALYQKIVERGLDVRVFYDHRAIDLSESKKTPVRFCPVDPRSLAAGHDSRFGGGVFHPKIILLQNDKGRAWVFASSANLTVAGWSRNREAVIDREIQSRANLERVLEFFQTISGEPLEQHSSFHEKTKREGWEFVHSLGGEPFLDRLLADRPRTLFVWSPYFSDDLAAMLDQQLRPRMASGARIGIVPDLTDGRIRLPDSARDALRSLEWLECYGENLSPAPSGSPRMSHAKVWLTESRLALGSWNLTASALASPAQGSGWNVEAGIILPADRNAFRALRPKEILGWPAVEFMTREELEQEREVLMRPLPFRIQVFRDWAHDRYEIEVSGDTPESLYTIRLPGVDRHRRLEFAPRVQQVAITDLDRALKEHVFAVFRRDAPQEEEPYRGIIIDRQTADRPVWRFSSFHELLHAWSQESAGDPSRNADSLQLAYVDKLDHPFHEEEARDPLERAQEGITFSYFTMFRAFENIRQRLLPGKTPGAAELRAIVKVHPGCLFELVDKARKILRQAANEPTNDPQARVVYKWFLQEEVNALLRIASRRAERLGEAALARAIEGRVLHTIEDRSLFERFEGPDRRWIRQVRQLAEYEERR